MGQAIPRQHPAVVLRSHYRQLRALLALALVLVAGLSTALVIVASDDEGTTGTSVAAPGKPIAYGEFSPQTGRPLANVAKPDESRIAAAVAGTQQATEQTGSGGPDEAKIASSIGNGTPEPSVSQAHPGARP